MLKTDRPKSSLDQEPLLISLKRWEVSEEREIEKKSNFHQDQEISPSIKFLRLLE